MTNILERLKTALADRYAIEREIGAGGMATVYLAEDLKHHRQVAVKVLRPELAATLGPERFLREIETAARLTHPHILPLYDSGDAGGFLYYVMPYIEGESLRDKLTREGELPVAEAVRILRDVVDALAKAHSQGVVHRDIKPDNILLADRHAMVADFGVAKAVSEASLRHEFPDNVAMHGYQGTIAARLENRDEALRISDELAAIDRPYVFGNPALRRAKIAAILGDREQAVSFLREAYEKGSGFGIGYLHDMDLESLRDYPPFEEWIRPKG